MTVENPYEAPQEQGAALAEEILARLPLVETVEMDVETLVRAHFARYGSGSAVLRWASAGMAMLLVGLSVWAISDAFQGGMRIITALQVTGTFLFFGLLFGYWGFVGKDALRHLLRRLYRHSPLLGPTQYVFETDCLRVEGPRSAILRWDQIRSVRRFEDVLVLKLVGGHSVALPLKRMSAEMNDVLHAWCGRFR